MPATVDKEIIVFAHTLADAAGEIARHYFRKPLTPETKSDLSPVTQADREIETAIVSLIKAHFPEHGIFGEEYGHHNEDAPWQWVIDPIDGTRAFLAGYPTFTTLIALAHHGVPLLGVIDQAVMYERWTGVNGERTQCNGKDIYARGIVSLDKAIVGTTSTPYYFNKQEAAAFDWVKDQCAHVVQGGDGYGYAMLASGRIDVFIDAGLKPYDFCALRPVIEGAGGIITDWEGNPLTIASEGHVIAAATKELHKQVIAVLQQTVA